MKQLKIGLISILLISFLSSHAQQNHFIYIQTENKQPFYVKLSNQFYSSSNSGYIVLPKLKNGQYTLNIGFPKSEWPEQEMVCTIDNKDVGFLLKNFGDKGWGLFNMQTLDIVMSGIKPKASATTFQTKTDDFSNLLSNVVNDPSIKQVDPVEEPKRPEKSESVKAIETVIVDSSAPANVAEVNIEQPKSTITRTLLNKDSEGIDMVFIDEIDGKKDTVRIFIPINKKSQAGEKSAVSEKKEVVESKAENDKPTSENNSSVANKPGKETNFTDDKSIDSIKTESVKKEERPEEKRFIEMELPVRDVNSKSDKKITEQVTAGQIENKTEDVKKEKKKKEEKKTSLVIQQTPMINSDCKSLASEEDFLKLRKKMVGEDNDDDMIGQAKKMFRTKCFTVEQVKNLSVLFLTDIGKYNFFDTAYPFVSDSHNFINLQGQLSDSYYISRFQAMIRH